MNIFKTAAIILTLSLGVSCTKRSSLEDNQGTPVEPTIDSVELVVMPKYRRSFHIVLRSPTIPNPLT